MQTKMANIVIARWYRKCADNTKCCNILQSIKLNAVGFIFYNSYLSNFK